MNNRHVVETMARAGFPGKFGLTLRMMLTIILAVILCLPVSAIAEFYRYRDENGALRFTDNLAEVPPEQRPKVDRYQQAEDFQPPADRPSKPPRTEQAGDDEENEGARQSAPDRRLSSSEIANRYEELNAKKAELDAEYKELVSAQQAILEARNAATTPEEKFEVNQKVMTLNRRIADFEKKRADLEQAIQAFNEIQQ